MTDPVLFVLTVLTILITPGPTNTLLAIGGASLGLRRGWPLLIGEAIGYGISITTIGAVLRPLLAQSPDAVLVLRVLVSGYLLYLAQHILRGRLVADAGAVITVRRVFVATLLNPKAMVFALVVVPFGAPGVALYMLGFFGVLVPVALCWIALGAAVGRASVGTRYERWILRAGALAITTFAILLLVSVVLHFV